MSTDPLRRRSIAALVAVNVLWGISFPAMKAVNIVMEEHTAGGRIENASFASEILDRTLAASFLTCVRFAISFVLLALSVPRLFRGMTWSHWWMGIWTGLVFAPGFIMQNIGLNYVPASRSGFLTSLTVVFTPIVMIVLERRPPRWLVVGGIILGLMGTAILTGLIEIDGPTAIHFAKSALSQLGLGDWLTVTAALVFTGQILIIDHCSRRMPAGQLTPGMFIATLAVGLVAFTVGQAWSPGAHDRTVWTRLLVDARFLAIVAVLSIFCTVLAFHWMNKYQGHVTPAQAALIYTTEPIFATLWAMVLPSLFSPLCRIDYASERPGRELLIGGLFVVLGNVLALWPVRTTAPAEPALES